MVKQGTMHSCIIVSIDTSLSYEKCELGVTDGTFPKYFRPGFSKLFQP